MSYTQSVVTCLDANDLVSYLSGELSSSEVARVEEHLDLCEACRELLSVCGRIQAEESAVAPADTRAGELLRGAVVGRFVLLADCSDVEGRLVAPAFDGVADGKVELELLPVPAGRVAEHVATLRAYSDLEHRHLRRILGVWTFGDRLLVAHESRSASRFEVWLARRPGLRERFAVLRGVLQGTLALAAAGCEVRAGVAMHVTVGAQGDAQIVDYHLPALGLAGDDAGAFDLASIAIRAVYGRSFSRDEVVRGAHAIADRADEPALARRVEHVLCQVLVGERDWRALLDTLQLEPGPRRPTRRLAQAAMLAAAVLLGASTVVMWQTLGPARPGPKGASSQTEKLKTDEPKTEELKTEELKTEELKTEKPKTDEPKTDEPKTDEPKTDEPKTDENSAELATGKASVIPRAADLSHPAVTFPLTGLGLALLDLDRAREAIAPLERSLAVHAVHPMNAADRARTRFALARALWSSDRERGRAVALARLALADFGEGELTRAERNAVAAWLRDKDPS